MSSDRESTDEHRQQSPKTEQKGKTISRSSTPSDTPKQPQAKSDSLRRISLDRQSNDEQRQQSPKTEQKPTKSSRSSISSDSSKPLQNKQDSSRRISSAQKPTDTPHSDNDDQG